MRHRFDCGEFLSHLTSIRSGQRCALRVLGWEAVPNPFPPVFAAVTAMLWSHSTKLSAGTAAMPSLQELHTVAGVKKVPNQEIKDQSLIFPSIAKR